MDGFERKDVNKLVRLVAYTNRLRMKHSLNENEARRKYLLQKIRPHSAGFILDVWDSVTGDKYKAAILSRLTNAGLSQRGTELAVNASIQCG